MRMLAVLLLAASWVCGVPVARAAVPESPRLRVIGVADGLPSSNVNGMARVLAAGLLRRSISWRQCGQKQQRKNAASTYRSL